MRELALGLLFFVREPTLILFEGGWRELTLGLRVTTLGLCELAIDLSVLTLGLIFVGELAVVLGVITLDMRVLTLGLLIFLREPAIALRKLTLDFICRRSEEANHRTLILYGGSLRKLTAI